MPRGSLGIRVMTLQLSTYEHGGGIGMQDRLGILDDETTSVRIPGAGSRPRSHSIRGRMQTVFTLSLAHFR